jgi:hypothetical protein
MKKTNKKWRLCAGIKKALQSLRADVQSVKQEAARSNQQQQQQERRDDAEQDDKGEQPAAAAAAAAAVSASAMREMDAWRGEQETNVAGLEQRLDAMTADIGRLVAVEESVSALDSRVTSSTSVRETPFGTILYCTMIFLPRHARDKHKETLKREAFSCRLWRSCCQKRSSSGRCQRLAAAAAVAAMAVAAMAAVVVVVAAAGPLLQMLRFMRWRRRSKPRGNLYARRSPICGAETSILRHFVLKPIIWPRQARDKHKEKY